MKPICRTLLICLLPISALVAQEPAAPATAPAEKQLSYQIEFSNLPEEKRKEYAVKLAEGQRLYTEQRIFESLEKAGEAKAIFENDPQLLTLIGACQVEFRNFDKAMENFKKADELAPGMSAVLFNIAELNFVTKDWKQAEINLQKVSDLTAASTDRGDIQLSRLVEFKLLLTKLKLGKKEEALKLAAKYDFLDDSPFPYYAQAAISFSEGRDLDAEASIARAARIFQKPLVVAPWQDTMVEFGYIKGFFGGDQAEAK
ncbi:hypothetical protein [Luteolibacter luteus]|uniref:Tetratricopeptide repeat protein n=1 Tax=Luteolibacter luteus TaxID=2728835 RepID=A0A858RFY6_9BACT|nr:hypothetical protein [Luteolibacter luteus]QJE95053.1 hypothetical protein HHL09_04450 [Luteolibacter luteus]